VKTLELESVLPDGTRVLFRPIEPSDKQMLQEGLRQLSDESRYRRFFRHIDHLSEKQLRYLTEVDGHDHVAWVAVLPELPGVPGVGVGRYIRLANEPDVAEAAVTVVDSYHHQGLGRTLLWLLARSAIEHGVGSFRAWTLGENHPMMELLRSLGAQPGRWEGGALELTVPLPADLDDLDQSPAPLILKEVARGTLQVEAHPDHPAGARLISPSELWNRTT
jgi:GNAT superfamily N-acetyltransferase